MALFGLHDKTGQITYAYLAKNAIGKGRMSNSAFTHRRAAICGRSPVFQEEPDHLGAGVRALDVGVTAIG